MSECFLLTLTSLVDIFSLSPSLPLSRCRCLYIPSHMVIHTRLLATMWPTDAFAIFGVSGRCHLHFLGYCNYDDVFIHEQPSVTSEWSWRCHLHRWRNCNYDDVFVHEQPSGTIYRFICVLTPCHTSMYYFHMFIYIHTHTHQHV